MKPKEQMCICTSLQRESQILLVLKKDNEIYERTLKRTNQPESKAPDH